jgi:hypothetical protein
VTNVTREARLEYDLKSMDGRKHENQEKWAMDTRQKPEQDRNREAKGCEDSGRCLIHTASN